MSDIDVTVLLSENFQWNADADVARGIYFELAGGDVLEGAGNFNMDCPIEEDHRGTCAVESTPYARLSLIWTIKSIFNSFLLLHSKTMSCTNIYNFAYYETDIRYYDNFYYLSVFSILLHIYIYPFCVVTVAAAEDFGWYICTWHILRCPLLNKLILISLLEQNRCDRNFQKTPQPSNEIG